jgi:hypothetical protein
MFTVYCMYGWKCNNEITYIVQLIWTNKIKIKLRPVWKKDKDQEGNE